MYVCMYVGTGLPAWGFLLVFYNNYCLNMHRFELGAWDRQTDRQTDTRTDRSSA